MNLDLLESLEAAAYADEARELRPTDADWLWDWVHAFTGIRIPRRPVCRGHTAPFEFFARQVLERPRLALWHGPRGSGKSFLSAVDTHLASRFNPRHGTRILGGSLAQSAQIYEAIKGVILDGRGPLGGDQGAIKNLLSTRADYHNGSKVEILAASAKSVRGPHVPSLKLDEVDEIDPQLRDDSMGMAMEMRGVRLSVLMTSTWHRVAGPMADLVKRGRETGLFPVSTYCVFEVLERCPEERSGPNLELCPACPIQRWCHSDREEHPARLPKAKRSNGHYTIDSLIQKVEAVSPRMFESDYLCLEPRAAGAWFTEFDRALHVAATAEFNPRWPVHVAVDPGVETGGVWFQVQKDIRGNIAHVNVFGDYYAYDIGAEANAQAVKKRTRELCGLDIRQCRYSMDSAASHKTSVGPVLLGEYERVECRGRNGIEAWPVTLKTDQLALIEALIMSADRKVRLTIHPRCKHLIAAFGSYQRAKRGSQWMDQPADPQHPHEDLIDPLAGGLKLEAPEGRTPPPNLRRVPANRFF